MKNNQFKQLNKIIKSRKSHAGFTLIELLSGLIMSTIVVAGLGFGLYQLTKITRDEGNKITARNEILRAREFISDELRRAQQIQVDNSIGNLNDAAVAPDYNLPSGAIPNDTAILALQMPGVTQRIIYSVAPPQTGSPWKGPLVIYRWGPNMNSNGEYTDPNDTTDWKNKALMDGVDNVPVSTNDTCNGSTVNFTGFFACIEDDDGDGIVEDGLTDTNGDGVVNLIDDDGIENDSVDDNDGFAITAKLYFANDIDIAYEDTDNRYVADTQVVARARARNTNAAEEEETSPLSFKTLAAEYSLGPRGGGAECNGKSSWTMRTDFINDPNLNSDSSYSPKTWIHDPDRQGQPINIDTNHKLTIASIPIGYGPCTNSSMILSRGNETADDTTSTHTKAGDGSVWVPKDDDNDGNYDFETSDFTIDFSDPTTFNGDDESDSSYDNPDPGVDYVRVYKKGSTLADYAGYDDDPDTPGGEDSLGEFLAAKGYAVPNGTTPDGKITYRLVNDSDYAANPTLNILGEKERLIAVEIGQALVGDKIPGSGDPGVPNPGFDLQDSVFILSTEKFAEKYTYP